MRISLLVVLAGCTAEYQVLLDGEPQDGLADAAANASPGSVIELQPITYEGGVVLPNDVTIEGNGATIEGGSGSLLSGGDLTLRNLVLIGGSAEDGAAVRGDALVLENIEQSGAEGLVAIGSNRAVTAIDSSFEHQGIAIRARSNLGRSREVVLEEVWTSGDLDVEADDASLLDVEAFQITAGGLNARLERTTATGIGIRGRAVQGFELQADLGAIEVDTVTLSELGGTSWSVLADLVQGVGWSAQTIDVQAEDAVLTELEATDLRLVAEQTAQVLGANADTVRLAALSLEVSDLEGRDIELAGFGLQQDVRATGAQARLSVNQGTLRSAILASESTPVHLAVTAADVRNLLVFEPPTAAGTYLAEVTSYATIEQSTFRVGTRTALAPPVPVGWNDSVLYGVALGEIVGENIYDDTVVWSETEVLPLRAGMAVADPLFLPGSPVLNPLSDWIDHGAFAGPYGVQVQQRWDALGY